VLILTSLLPGRPNDGETIAAHRVPETAADVRRGLVEENKAPSGLVYVLVRFIPYLF
jgi:hypothetical protein